MPSTGPTFEDQRLTWEQLHRLANAVAEPGIGKDDKVAIGVDNCWLHCGEFGYVGEDGFLCLVTRRGECDRLRAIS